MLAKLLKLVIGEGFDNIQKLFPVIDTIFINAPSPNAGRVA